MRRVILDNKTNENKFGMLKDFIEDKDIGLNLILFTPSSTSDSKKSSLTCLYKGDYIILIDSDEYREVNHDIVYGFLEALAGIGIEYTFQWRVFMENYNDSLGIIPHSEIELYSKGDEKT